MDSILKFIFINVSSLFITSKHLIHFLTYQQYSLSFQESEPLTVTPNINLNNIPSIRRIFFQIDSHYCLN